MHDKAHTFYFYMDDVGYEFGEFLGLLRDFSDQFGCKFLLI